MMWKKRFTIRTLDRLRVATNALDVGKEPMLGEQWSTGEAFRRRATRKSRPPDVTQGSRTEQVVGLCGRRGRGRRVPSIVGSSQDERVGSLVEAGMIEHDAVAVEGPREVMGVSG